jgi:hypothetical protein
MTTGNGIRGLSRRQELHLGSVRTLYEALSSVELRVVFCMVGCEDRTLECEAEESPMLEAIVMERLKTQQAGKRLSGCCDNF